MLFNGGSAGVAPSCAGVVLRYFEVRVVGKLGSRWEVGVVAPTEAPHTAASTTQPVPEMVRAAATKDEFDAILAGASAAGRAVVVDFTATWCGPCRAIAPIFSALATEFSHVDFLKVDVDVNQETAVSCGVRAMPTFQIFRGGAKVAELKGANPDALRQLIQQHAGEKPRPKPDMAARQMQQRGALAALLAVPDKARAHAAASTIVKIVANVLANPTEPKFRALKCDNRTVKEKVLACPGGRELLLAAGFEERDVGMIARPEMLVLPSEADLSELAQLRAALETVTSHLEAGAAAPAAQ